MDIEEIEGQNLDLKERLKQLKMLNKHPKMRPNKNLTKPFTKKRFRKKKP